MLRSFKHLKGFHIQAKDGKIGKVDDFYFDDHSWRIRYLIADTGNWLESRLVLISPAALRQPNWDEETFPVDLTKTFIEKSPDISKDKPVSKQHETDMINYYQWPVYWDPGMGNFPVPDLVPVPDENKENDQEDKPKGDPNLRSCNEIIDYDVKAIEDNIGHIDDFIIDDETWQIHYLVVDTGKWLLSGDKFLLFPNWISRIDWTDSSVYVDLAKDIIEKSPKYDDSKEITREYESSLFNYFGKPKYW